MDVSVIIPLHDGAATIRETLDSLLEQGDLALEVVVVDDRSTDDGPALARSHPLAPRVIPSPAPGPAAARNAGFAGTTGRYVVFLDADDLLLPGALPGRVAAADAAGGGSVIVGQHDDLVDGRRERVAEADRFRDGSAASLLRGNRLALHAALTPRSLLAALDGLFDARMWHGEDWGVWLRLACRGTRFVALDRVDCLYRRRPGSLSTDRDRVADDAIRMLGEARAWVAGADDARSLEAVRRRELHRWHRYRARRRLRRGAVAVAVRDLAAAVAAAPAAGLPFDRPGPRGG